MPFTRHYKSAIFLSASAAGLFAASAAQAVTFNFSYSDTVTREQKIGFEMAGDIWSSYLTDAITVNIGVDMTTFPDASTLGKAAPGMDKKKLKDYAKGLERQNQSSYDRQALESLKALSPDGKLKEYRVIEDTIHKEREEADKKIREAKEKIREEEEKKKQGGKKREEAEKKIREQQNKIIKEQRKLQEAEEKAMQKATTVEEEEDIYIARANAKAIGMIKADDDKVDGYVLLDKNRNWNDHSYTNWRGPSRNSEHDLLTVALHEIGHNLGFVSGVDTFGTATTLDLFRYSDESFGSNAIDLRPDRKAFFSFDGGKTKTRLAGEDGYQESHWHSDYENSLMNPRVAPGHRLEIAGRELQSLDTIGWDVNYGANIDLTKLAADAEKRVDGRGFDEYDREKATKAMEGDNRRGSNYGMGFWAWRQEDGSGTAQQVPEPTSIVALLGTALLGLGVRRKRS